MQKSIVAVVSLVLGSILFFPGQLFGTPTISTTWCNGDHSGGGVCLKGELYYKGSGQNPTIYSVESEFHPGAPGYGSSGGAQLQWGGDLDLDGWNFHAVDAFYQNCSGTGTKVHAAEIYTDNASWWEARE